MDIKDLYKENYIGKEIEINGWIKNHRKHDTFGFIDLFDGTCMESIQVVYKDNLSNFNEISKLLVGSAINVKGSVIESEGTQAFEIDPKEIIILNENTSDYPLQSKGRPTREFLREISYLRPRTNLYNAIFRVRSTAAFAIHKYFNENGYVYVHTPLITSNDGEGAGEMFKVTTFDLDNIPHLENKDIDYSKDFFGKKVGLTVTGQLQGEAFAHAYKKIYTFGPTFRAEQSHTKTHASEFWMIEPEIAFCDLKGVMKIEEEMLKYVIKYVLENCESEMQFFNKFVDKNLLERLNNLVNSDFARVTHKEAIDILLKSGKKWEFTPKYKEDISTEHEKYLTEEYFKSPVFVTDWPKDIKAFYMRLNDDNETVAAVDLLVPGSGELMGGSQREERLDLLNKRMDELHMDKTYMDWYLNLRKYGGVVHGGFGMGFERLIIYITGVDNIRDVIPFPRTPNNCDY